MVVFYPLRKIHGKWMVNNENGFGELPKKNTWKMDGEQWKWIWWEDHLGCYLGYRGLCYHGENWVPKYIGSFSLVPNKETTLGKVRKYHILLGVVPYYSGDVVGIRIRCSGKEYINCCSLGSIGVKKYGYITMCIYIYRIWDIYIYIYIILEDLDVLGITYVCLHVHGDKDSP